MINSTPRNPRAIRRCKNCRQGTSCSPKAPSTPNTRRWPSAHTFPYRHQHGRIPDLPIHAHMLIGSLQTEIATRLFTQGPFTPGLQGLDQVLSRPAYRGRGNFETQHLFGQSRYLAGGYAVDVHLGQHDPGCPLAAPPFGSHGGVESPLAYLGYPQSQGPKRVLRVLGLKLLAWSRRSGVRW